jgi:hypothetical protein
LVGTIVFLAMSLVITPPMVSRPRVSGKTSRRIISVLPSTWPLRIDALVGLLTVEVLLKELLHLGDPGAAADEHDLVEFALAHPDVRQGLLHRLHHLAEQHVIILVLELRPDQWL